MRKWAFDALMGFQSATVGTRNDEARNAIAAYVDRITIWPSKKCGEMVLNTGATVLWRRHRLEEENRRKHEENHEKHHDRSLEGNGRGLTLAGAKSDPNKLLTKSGPENNTTSPLDCSLVPLPDDNLTPPPTDNLILRFTWGREGIIDQP